VRTAELQERLKQRADQVNSGLEQLLPSAEELPAAIHEAMRYSVFSGGKRLRPTMLLETTSLLGGSEEAFLPAACAIELIHCYSLVHDDLPAMDDDDYRRGKPTCHRVYGEAMAVLTGDALLTHAFQWLAQLRTSCDDPTALLQAVGDVAAAAGTGGIIGGQVLDLEAENREVELQALQRIHQLKTGRLFEASLRFPAIVLGASGSELEALTRYARAFGVAFQIVDDILDIVGDERKLGKPIGSDSASCKATYPSLMGLEASRQEAAQAVEQAVKALVPFGERAGFFRQLANFVLDRDH
jgi:geranylgeranyl diphosphate synthase type II